MGCKKRTVTSTVDFSVTTPLLSKTNAAIGKNIGISIISTVATAGGVWDVENVRFSAEALRVRSEKIGNNLHITWASKTGSSYQLQTSSDLVNWSDTGAVIAGNNGEISIDLPISGSGTEAFYKLRLTTAP